MGHNLTMMELGWLCTALVSLMRSSPPHLVLVNADQNAQKMLQLINDSKCATTATSKNDSNDGTTLWPPTVQLNTNAADAVLLENDADRRTASSVQQQFEQNSLLADNGTRRLLDWLMTFVYTLISMFGIVGNIFVVIVVRTGPGMITPTNCYLMSLAVSDCIFLLSAAPVELSFLHVDWYAFGSIGCKVLSFLPFLGINSSSMSITAFTVERFIGICYPLRARYICTVKRARLIILFIWCFCILYNSPWLYLATLIVDAETAQCSFRLERDDWAYKVMFVADFLAFYLIPMIMYIYIYTKIIYTLTRSEIKYSIANDLIHRNSQDIRPELGANAVLITALSAAEAPPPPDSPTANGGAAGTKSVTQKRSQHGRDSVVIAGCGPNGGRSSTTKGKVQVIKMLALVVFIFAVCWLPYRAMVMYNSFAKNFKAEMWNPEWFIYLSKTMIFFNCAINPVLYNLMSARFRQAFLRLLSGKKQFINSYKRDSVVCAPTANGKMMIASAPTAAAPRYRTTCRSGDGSPDTPAAAAATANDATSSALLLSRMTAADAETRATLMLRVQRNAANNMATTMTTTTTCHGIIVPKTTKEKDEDEKEEADM